MSDASRGPQGQSGLKQLATQGAKKNSHKAHQTKQNEIIENKSMDYSVRNTNKDMKRLNRVYSHLFLDWPLFILFRPLCVTRVLLYLITKLQFVKKGTAAASWQPRLPFNYRRILGADLSSVTVLRSLTPRRMVTSMSTSPVSAEDSSRGAL